MLSEILQQLWNVLLTGHSPQGGDKLSNSTLREEGVCCYVSGQDGPEWAPIRAELCG